MVMSEYQAGENSLTQMDWEWPITPTLQKHSDRMALLRPILFELTSPATDMMGKSFQGRALSVNISKGGMLLIMDIAPVLEQVMKIYVPTPIEEAETPTLAEVRWTRKMPFPTLRSSESYFVGLKFLF
jgi:hypothetical protein